MGGNAKAGSVDGCERQAKLIVVVDRDAGHRYYLSMLLQKFGYRVLTTGVAAEALERVQVAVPSLIVCDLHVPDPAADALLRQLRIDPRTASVPIIAVVENDAAAQHSAAAGFTASARKPVALEELYRVVQSAIEPTPRANIRIHTTLAVTVNGAALDCVEGECASVLSEHGMYIRTLKPAAVKSRLSVTVTLNGKTIPIEAVVLYSHRFGEGPFGEPGMGIKFLRAAPQDQSAIRAYIHERVMQEIAVTDAGT